MTRSIRGKVGSEAAAPSNRLWREMSLGNVQPHLGHVLRRLGTDVGFTLERLAEQSSVNWAYIGQVERGECQPTVGVFFRMAVSLGQTPSETLKLLEKEMENPTPVEIVTRKRPTKIDDVRANESRPANPNRREVILVDWAKAVVNVIVSRPDFKSYNDVTKACAIPQGTIRRLLQGESDFQVSTLERLAWGCGTTFRQLAEMGQLGATVAEPTANLEAVMISRSGEDVVLVDWSMALKKGMASNAELKNPARLAKAANVSPQTLRHTIRKGGDPLVSTLERIAKALGIPFAALAEMGQRAKPIDKPTAD